MNRKIRIAAIAVGILIVVLLIIPALVDVNSFRPKIESEMSSALGRTVKLGNLSLSIFSGSVGADDISIADDTAYSKDPFITAKSFKAGVNVMPLIFSKTLHITGITLEEPQIVLLRGPNGKWNFSSLGGGSQASPAQPVKETGKSGNESGNGPEQALAVDKLTIENGRLLIGTANSTEKPAAYDKVKLEVTNFSATTQFPFSLTAAFPGGGDLDVQGKCGPLDAAAIGSTPIEASLKANQLDLAASGLVAASSGIQGVIDFDGAINSNGQQAKVNGTLKADKLKLAVKGAPAKPTVTIKLAADYDLKTDTATISQGDMSIGKATARLSGTYQTQGPVSALNLKLDGNDMPIDEFVAALPALGLVFPSGVQPKGGALTVNFTVTGGSDNPVTAGSLRLSNMKLAGFDMGSKLSAIPGLSARQSGSKDTVIQNLSANVRVAPEATQASAINVTIPSLGVVTGAGSISPAGALNFNMVADLAGAEGSRAQKGSGVPFAIEGTTSDPKFVPNIKGIAGAAVSSKVKSKVPSKRRR